MSILKRWRRWSARLLRVGCLASAVTAAGFALASPAPAQDGGAPGKGARHVTNRTKFHLPIVMSPAQRSKIQEFRLFVKQASGDWVQVETAPPTANYFSPHVKLDGEYWFSLQTVAKSGELMPPDVRAVEPSQRVVVDTNPPVIEVQPAVAPDGEFCIKCTVVDANLDMTSLRAVSRTERGEVALMPVPGMVGGFRVAKSDYAYPVRVTAVDQAKNLGTREVNITELVRAVPKTELSHASHKVAAPPSGPIPGPGPIPPGLVEVAPPPLPRKEFDLPGMASGPVTLPPKTVPEPMPIAPAIPAPHTIASLTPTTPAAPVPTPPGLVEIPAPRPDMPMPGSPTPAAIPAAPAATLPDGKGPRQLLNTPMVSIDYRIDHVGPSGVSRVDVYLTADSGQNWKKVKEDADRRTPVEVDLPGEGLFGLKLVITNGNGFGGTPPVRGEQPTVWVEVDATNPHVTLQPIEPITSNGFLEIRWTAADSNLGAEPVSLYFRTRAEGPWQPIVKNLRNDGLYRWAFPRDMGGQFWIKAEVVDQAGNVTRSETGPVVLDLTEPRAAVLGVTSISARPTPPVGP